MRNHEPLRMTIRTLVFALTPNIPTAGTKTGQITIVGYEFKETNLTPSMLIGSTICRSLSWTAKTSMKCWADAGYGTSLKATITISDGVPCTLSPGVASQSARHLFCAAFQSIDELGKFYMTYDSPSVTSLSRDQVPPGGGDVQVWGLNFGVEDSSPTVWFQNPNQISAACDSSSWVSVSAVTCYVPRLSSDDLQCSTCKSFSPIVTVGAIVGTAGVYFTYDLSFKSDTGGNSPASGGALIRVHGADFDVADRSPSVVVGMTVCLSTSWTSWTTLGCFASSGVGVSLSAKSYYQLSVTSMIGTLGSMFSYDAPVITVVKGLDVATLNPFGFEWATIHGANFGAANTSPTATLRSQCIRSLWTSDTALACYYAPYNNIADASVRKTASVTVASLAGCGVDVFSYAQPVAPTLLAPPNAPITGGTLISVTGTNFRGSDHSGSLVFEPTVCTTTSWIAWTSLTCSVGAGGNSFTISSASAKLVSAIMVSFGDDVLDLAGNLQSVVMGSVFTYDSPVMTAASELRIDSNTGETKMSPSYELAPPGYKELILHGINFAGKDPTASVRVRIVVCRIVLRIIDAFFVCRWGRPRASPLRG
jgi:hypothetical protein